MTAEPFEAMKHLATIITIRNGTSKTDEQIELAALCALVELQKRLISNPSKEAK
jgi:hypothetical protein